MRKHLRRQAQLLVMAIVDAIILLLWLWLFPVFAHWYLYGRW
jgi:hypothetical protein